MRISPITYTINTVLSSKSGIDKNKNNYKTTDRNNLDGLQAISAYALAFMGKPKPIMQ